jgi:DNA-binding transcriptional LysR family regulator
MVDDFLAANPGIRVRLLLLDRVVDLVQEGIDAAVRIGHLPDSSLTAIRLGYVHSIVCASSAPASSSYGSGGVEA